MRKTAAALVLALVLALFAAMNCAAPPLASLHWEPVVVWQGESAFERVKVGRPDPSDPQPQIVGVDQGGRVVLVHWNGGTPRAEVLLRHPGELTGLVVADVDVAIAGEEIYVGGFESGESGGSVTQLVLTPAGTQTKRLWTGDAYVHSVERVDPLPGGAPQLLFATYRGEIHLLTPSASGAWADRVLYRDPPASDIETPKIKDAGFLATADGSARRVALVAFKTGRLLRLDLDHPETARVVLDERGGLSRVTADRDGGAYVTGYFGRLLHLVPQPDGFRVDELDDEGEKSGLRGCVQGRFPLPDGSVAPLAVFGFHALCRALVPRLGAWDPTTLYRDIDRGHTIEAADLVPGNDADELIVSGYSKRLTVLVARR